MKSETRNKVQEGGIREVRTAIILSLLIVGSTIAQTGKVTSSNGTGQTWQIPFASTGNTISLSVQNKSRLEAKSVSVTFNRLVEK